MAKLYVSNKDESARLFGSGFLEIFTHVHWSVPIIVYLPVVVYCLAISPATGILSTTGIIMEFVAGLFVWTLTEYLLHRFVFHYEPKTGWGKRLHFLMHGVHHDYPQDSKRLVMPPVISIPLAALFLGLFSLILPRGTLLRHLPGSYSAISAMMRFITRHTTHHEGKAGPLVEAPPCPSSLSRSGSGLWRQYPRLGLRLRTMYGEKEEISVEAKEG